MLLRLCSFSSFHVFTQTCAPFWIFLLHNIFNTVIFAACYTCIDVEYSQFCMEDCQQISSCISVSYITHLSLSYSGCFFKCIVMSTGVKCILYLANNSEMKIHKEKEQTAEPVMRGKLDNRHNRSQTSFIPQSDVPFTFAGWVFLEHTPSWADLDENRASSVAEKLSHTWRHGFIFLDLSGDNGCMATKSE